MVPLSRVLKESDAGRLGFKVRGGSVSSSNEAVMGRPEVGIPERDKHEGRGLGYRTWLIKAKHKTVYMKIPDELAISVQLLMTPVDL